MARQSLTLQSFTKQALFNPTYTNPAGATGVQWQNTGREVLAIINGATPSTATINFGVTVEGQPVTAYSTPLPTSNTTPQFLGPFSPAHFNNPDGNIYIDLSSVTGLTLAVLQEPGVQ
jgi:hypothetical protein